MVRSGDERPGDGSEAAIGVDPLWSSVWRALAAQPATGIAVVLAVAVAAMVAAAAPLFESSLGNEVFRQRLATADPVDAGLTISVNEAAPRGGAIAALERAIADSLPVGDHLDVPVLTIAGRSDPLENRIFRADPAAPDAERRRLEEADPPPWEEGRRAVQLFARPGATDHLDVLWTNDEPGVWVPDTVAEEIGLQPGEDVLYTVAMSAEDRTVLRLTVAGIYRDLWEGGLGSYWQQVPEAALSRPPTTVIAEHQRRVLLVAEPDEVIRVAAQAGEVVSLTWQVPVAGPEPTLTEGRRLAAAFRHFDERFLEPEGQLRLAWQDVRPSPGTPATASVLPTLLAAAEEGRQSIRPLLRSLSLAGVGLGLGVVAVAGASVTRRRANEVRLLWSQGVGPVAHGLRSTLELIPAAVLGAALGWAGAVGVVWVQGPWGAVEPAWAAEAARGALAAAGVGLAALFVVAAVTARSLTSEREAVGGRARTIAFAVLGVATAASWLTVDAGRGGDPSGLLVQAFPLLVIAAAGALVTVGLAVVLGRWGRPLRPVWADLARQRLRTSALAAAPLVMASAVAIGLIVYATALASSTEVSVREKALASVGAVSSVELRDRYGDVERLPEGAHLVSRNVSRSGTAAAATVLVVDASALADDPPWGEGFTTVDLEAVARTLVERDDAIIPVVATGSPARPIGSTVAVDGRAASVLGTVVDHVDALPGMADRGPTYIVDRAAFAQVEPGETEPDALARQLWDFTSVVWADADEAALVGSVVGVGLDPRASDGIEGQLSAPRLLAQLAATDFVLLLGGVATLVAVGALALYGGARQRERVLGYALSRRMGLTTSEHRRALIAELIALLLLAALAGTPAAVTGLVAILPWVDPMPGAGPPMVLALPMAGLLVVPAALLLIGLLHATILQRRVESADVAEVLRVSD